MADINVIVLPDGTEYPVSDYYIPVAISNPTNGQVLKYDATNQVWYNGEDTSGSSILYGTSAPTSQLGTDGCLYVKYTEGTGGASDTVDALYVKLDGAWCQISTGGSSTFSGLDDVDLTTPQDGEVPEYDSTSQKWVNKSIATSKHVGPVDIASFSDGGDNIPVELFECEIVAQQASGTPTPDNPLLITGFDSADIVACGKNLLSFSTTTITSQTTIINDLFLKAGDYTFSIDVDNTTNIAGVFTIRIGTTAIATAGFVGNYQGRINKSFTLSQDSIINIVLGGASAGYSFTILNAQIEKGTATPYVPYTGTLYSIDFGQTIYGGRLIYSNGQWAIEATHADIMDLGALSWTKGSKSFYADITGAKIYAQSVIPNMLCEVYKPVSYNDLVSEQYNEVCSIDRNLNIILIRDTNYATASDFATAVTGKKAIYELATPIIIPLTSLAHIKTLSGVNNIFSNTGDSTVKYFTNNADEIAKLVKTEMASTDEGYHEYSTDEHVVGKWIDGKTLYEKTIDNTYGTDLSDIDIDEIVGYDAGGTMALRNNGTYMPCGTIISGNASYSFCFTFNKDSSNNWSIGIRNTSGVVLSWWRITIRYTKSS